MPTDYTWLGAVAPGNLSIADNYLPAAVPSVTGDTLVFGPTANQDDITEGLDQFNAVNFALVHRHPLFSGAFGSSGSPVKFVTEFVAGRFGQVIIQGPGKAFIEVGSGGSETLTRLYIDTDNQSDTIEINGKVGFASFIKGRMKGLSAFDADQIWVSYRTNPTSDVHFTQESTSAQPTGLYQSGGFVSWTGSVIAGNTVVNSGQLVVGPSGGVHEIISQTGGSIIYNAETTIDLVRLLGGVFDLSQDPRAKTISVLAVFPGATFIPNANTTISQNDPGTVLPLIPVTP